MYPHPQPLKFLPKTPYFCVNPQFYLRLFGFNIIISSEELGFYKPRVIYKYPESILGINIHIGSGHSAGSRLFKQHLLLSQKVHLLWVSPAGPAQACLHSSPKTSISWRQPRVSLPHTPVCTLSHLLMALGRGDPVLHGLPPGFPGQCPRHPTGDSPRSFF